MAYLLVGKFNATRERKDRIDECNTTEWPHVNIECALIKNMLDENKREDDPSNNRPCTMTISFFPHQSSKRSRGWRLGISEHRA
jgi:hypothetical protein